MEYSIQLLELERLKLKKMVENCGKELSYTTKLQIQMNVTDLTTSIKLLTEKNEQGKRNVASEVQ